MYTLLACCPLFAVLSVLGPLSLAVPALLQFAGAAVARNEHNPLRAVYAWLALLDLFVLTCFIWPTTQGRGEGVPYRVAAAFLAALLLVKLFQRTPLPDAWLPVRRIHARRLAAGAALFVLIAAGPLGEVLWSQLLLRPGPVAPWWGWIAARAFAAGLPCYLAPLWDVLARGWEPE